jgi:hypothetical protein
MTTPLETALKSLPPSQWVTRQAIAFDWYDGPREGICALARPVGEFYFELLDERMNPEDSDDRLFRLKELAAGSVEGAVRALEDLGGPSAPLWVPLWRFHDEAARRRAEQHLQELRAGARATPLVVFTRDMVQFLGCWTIDRSAPEPPDWFTALGIPQEQTTTEE